MSHCSFHIFYFHLKSWIFVLAMLRITVSLGQCYSSAVIMIFIQGIRGDCHEFCPNDICCDTSYFVTLQSFSVYLPPTFWLSHRPFLPIRILNPFFLLLRHILSLDFHFHYFMWNFIRSTWPMKDIYFN